jgi:tetratricopeptide (TPR) repeat protein
VSEELPIEDNEKELWERVAREEGFGRADSYIALARIAYNKGKFKESIAMCEIAREYFENNDASDRQHEILDVSIGISKNYEELNNSAEAAEALEKAVATNRKTYLDQASLMIIQAQYVQQKTEALQKAIDDYRRVKQNAAIPPTVLTWLGLKLYDQKLFPRCAQYLSLASTPDAPENTDPRVWSYLGLAFLETKDYESCVKATDHYLKATPESAARARGLVTKGRALLGLNQFEAADAVVQEGLGFAKDGKPQALLLILQGDVLSAIGNKLAAEGQADAAKAKHGEAAAKFMIPSQFFDDEEVTPEALDKASQALQKAGQSDKAAEFQKLLKQKYPSYSSKQ